MSDGLHLDSILTGKEVPMSIAEKLAAKKKADSITPNENLTSIKSNFSEPELIVSQSISHYLTLKSKEDIDQYIIMLESGKILTKDSTFIDKELANIILAKAIELGVRETSNVFAEVDIELDNEELHIADAYEQNVHDAIDKYADELLADSVLMFAEAMNFDPRFCDVIVRGDTQFFREVEDMGFPTLALMVKGITNRVGE